MFAIYVVTCLVLPIPVAYLVGDVVAYYLCVGVYCGLLVAVTYQ